MQNVRGDELWKRERQVRDPQSSVFHVHARSSCAVDRSGQRLVHFARRVCEQPVGLLQGEEPPLAVTSPLGLWPSTRLGPACCWPCTHTPPSPRAARRPRPGSTVRLPAAQWSPCRSRPVASHLGATAPAALDILKLK